MGGVSVSLSVTTPNGKTTMATGTTDITGHAYFQYSVSAKAPLGTYNVTAKPVTSGGGGGGHGKGGGGGGSVASNAASATGSFVVT